MALKNVVTAVVPRAWRTTLSAEQARSYLDVQLGVIAKMSPPAMTGMVALTITLAVTLVSQRSPAFAAGWLIATLLLTIPTALFCASRSRGRWQLSIDAQLWLASGTGVGYAVLFWLMYALTCPVLNPRETSILTLAVMGFASFGALLVSSVRGVAALFLGANTSGMLICSLLSDSGIWRIVAPALAVEWLVFMLNGVAFMARAHERRFVSERETAKERQTVGLLLQDFEGGSNDWLWETDRTGRFTRVSTRFCEVAGRSGDELSTMTLTELLTMNAHAADSTGRDTIRRRMTAQRRFVDIEVDVWADGHRRWWKLSGKPVSATSGWRGVGSDVTDAHEQQARIWRLANFDEITGLANRHRFKQRLDAALATPAGRTKTSLAILDLDGFKSVNDTHGHVTGDRLLRVVAERLTAATSPDVVCARIGGDEFAMLMAARSADDAVDFCARLVSVLEVPVELGAIRIHLSGCIGVAADPSGVLSAAERIVRADLALSEAKRAGRGQVVPFDEPLLAEARRRATVLRDLRVALDKGEFEVHYQPQLATATGGVRGFEALLRWQHPLRGLVPPGDFLPDAETSGLIVPIGRYVVGRACHEALQWPADITVAVNVSPLQLRAPDFASSVHDALCDSGLDPCRLEIEVTESSMVDAPGRLVLDELAAMGTRVALDDFGTGYSSLAHLRSLPVSQLKVDRSFIAPLTAAHDVPRALVAAIVQLADALGIGVVAEGIETLAQHQAVLDLGCGAVQGFLYGRPMPLRETSAFVAGVARNPVI